MTKLPHLYLIESNVKVGFSQGQAVIKYFDDGHYFGSIESGDWINPARQKKQVYLSDDDDFCREWSHRVIDTAFRVSR